MKLSELIRIQQATKEEFGSDYDPEIAVDDGTDKSPISIKSTSLLMDGYFLFLIYE